MNSRTWIAISIVFIMVVNGVIIPLGCLVVLSNLHFNGFSPSLCYGFYHSQIECNQFGHCHGWGYTLISNDTIEIKLVYPVTYWQIVRYDRGEIQIWISTTEDSANFGFDCWTNGIVGFNRSVDDMLPWIIGFACLGAIDVGYIIWLISKK